MNDQFYIHRCSSIKGETLDFFLSMGWYRYGAQIFTTNHYELEERQLPVYWMRYRVSDLVNSKKNHGILKKAQPFSIQERSFVLTEELEQVHGLYFDHIKFPTAPTIQLLLEDCDNEVYDTKLIEVRHNGRLIAAGIFDLGKNSVAGIKNFYDPAYKKFTPGKLLMLLKYRFCLAQNIEWYYPGYLIPGCKRFDYKLFLDIRATEFLDPETQEWKPAEAYRERLRHLISF